MGMNMNAFLEFKLYHTWIMYSPIHIERDYELFAKVAGLGRAKDRHRKLMETRGLPNDISPGVKACHDDNTDAIGESWMSLTEMNMVEGWLHTKYQRESCGKNWDYFPYAINFFGNSIYLSITDPNNSRLPQGLNGMRMVFWFDP